jgi:putative copper export protein
MLTNIILFIHIISAATWVGGGLLLFGMGIYFKDPKVQNTIYSHIGPFYGYFQLIWITLLIITGALLLNQHDLYSVILTEDFTNSRFGELLYRKLTIVLLVVLSTALHMYISLKAHGRERTQKEKIISRGSSMFIFLFNFSIIWYAMNISQYFV